MRCYQVFPDMSPEKKSEANAQQIEYMRPSALHFLRYRQAEHAAQMA